NVYLAGLALTNDKKNSIERAKKIIKKMGLSPREAHFPSELSGGEMQRTAMARALINEPEIILADEPTGSLDHTTAKEVFNVLYKLKNKNRLIIYATHNRFFANMADCKLEMIDGNIKTINARIK
ncbi:ATP-binding cassette domain-containing protein, partial [Candidatus Pelagibacter sp.]|nr:ATP-binding cassette domain-containing protein [Candidatus Pelagibacter sp.]